MTDEGTTPTEPNASEPLPMPPPPSESAVGTNAEYETGTSGLSTGRPVRSNTAPESGIRRQGGILMMVGALVVLASLPLTELTLTENGITTRAVSGMHGVALWLLVICVFAFMRGYSAIKPTAFRSSLPIASGLFVIWAIYTRWQGIDTSMKAAALLPGTSVSAGIGFWITCLGGALIVVGSVILQFVKPQHR